LKVTPEQFKSGKKRTRRINEKTGSLKLWAKVKKQYKTGRGQRGKPLMQVQQSSSKAL
jgi:hypothetical protein